MKLADIWKLGTIGEVDSTEPLGRLYSSLKVLERVLRVLHLRVEDTAYLPGAGTGQTLNGGTSGTGVLTLRGDATAASTVALEASVLRLGNTPGPSASSSVGSLLWSEDTSAGSTGAHTYAWTVGGKRERLTGLCVLAPGNFSKTNDTTLANVTGLTFEVEAGKFYSFAAYLHYDAGALGGTKYAIAGTCTGTTVLYFMRNFRTSTFAYVQAARATALAASGGQTGSPTGVIEITGTIAVANAGTLTVQFAQNAADGTACTVLAGSTFTLQPIGT